MKKKTKIMGIVNVTPDSFYVPSCAPTTDLAIEKAHKLIAEGADCIDIGGESSRPANVYGGLEKVSLEEELKRVIPVVKKLAPCVKVPLSIDTTKPEVAQQAIHNGATMINDITGFTDPEMRKLAATTQVDVCVMHMRGQPVNMQEKPFYEKGVVAEVYDFLDKQTKLLLAEGVFPEHIIIDPGIGFGKSVEDNFELVKNICLFQSLGFRDLYGISRKSFIYRFLNKERNDILSATIALNSQLILAQADMIRVHDVVDHREARDLLFMTRVISEPAIPFNVNQV